MTKKLKRKLKDIHLYFSLPAIFYHELTHVIGALLIGKYLKYIHFYRWNVMLEFNFKKIKLTDLFIYLSPIYGLIFLIYISYMYCPYLLIYIALTIKYLWLSKLDDNISEYIIRKFILKNDISFAETDDENNKEILEYFQHFPDYEEKYKKIKVF